MRVSLKLYKPWILLNRGVSSQLLTNLDKCAEAWTVSGLENALKTISDANGVEYAVLAKRLLSSIKHLGDLDLSHYSFNHDKTICRISLLTTEELQGTVWMILNSLFWLFIVTSLPWTYLLFHIKQT